jgi:hypothetical protein
MIKRDILPLNKWAKIILSLIILVIAIDLIVILFDIYNKLGLQHVSGKVLLKS